MVPEIEGRVVEEWRLKHYVLSYEYDCTSLEK